MSVFVRAIELRPPAGWPWKARLRLYPRLSMEDWRKQAKFLEIVFDGKRKMEFTIWHA